MTFAAYSIIMFEKLKAKWGIKSNWDVVAILIVFAISGSSIMFVKPIWFKIFGVTDATAGWLKFIIWLAMVFPTYQAFLLIYVPSGLTGLSVNCHRPLLSWYLYISQHWPLKKSS